MDATQWEESVARHLMTIPAIRQWSAHAPQVVLMPFAAEKGQLYVVICVYINQDAIRLDKILSVIVDFVKAIRPFVSHGKLKAVEILLCAFEDAISYRILRFGSTLPYIMDVSHASVRSAICRAPGTPFVISWYDTEIQNEIVSRAVEKENKVDSAS